MIEFKLSRLDKETLEIIQGLTKQEIALTDALAFSKVIEELSKVLFEKNNKELEITKKYAKKDENGDFVKPENEKEGFVIDNEIIPEFEKEITEYFNSTVSIPCEKLNLDSFKDAKVSTIGLLKINFLF